MRFFIFLTILIGIGWGEIANAQNNPFPTPNISTPDLDVTFSQPLKQGGYLQISYIGDFLTSFYQYLIGISITAAIVMIMIGGVQYTLAGGATSQVAKAKERITNAVIGLVMMLSVYVILYTVNPELVVYDPVTIRGIDRVVLEGKTLYEEESDQYSAGEDEAKSISASEYDDIFKAFANCIDVDWRILKVFAHKESGLSTTVENSKGFVGLFQTKPKFCRSALSAYPQWASECNNLKNPYVNTAVGASMLEKGIKKLDRCSDLTVEESGALIYLNHNSGGGSVNYILSHDGCRGEEEIKQGIIDFWNTYRNGRYEGEGLGERRGPYAFTVGKQIAAQGVTDFRDTSNNGDATCPFNNNPSNYETP